MREFAPENFLILAVDDVPRNLQTIGTVLDQSGYNITFANNGREALQRVKTAKPDLILLDLMMPEMDGFEVCQQLKANDLCREIPVIFLTASQDQQNVIKAFSVGAVDYITKPFRAPELLARVQTHLQLKHAQDQSKKALQALAIARDQALDASKIKSQFLANMSHELRTPLNAIMGISELLLASPLDESQQEFMTILKNRSQDLFALVENVLDFSQLTAQGTELEEASFALTPWLTEIIDLFKVPAKAKKIVLGTKLSPQLPPQLWGDRQRLQSTLEILLSNAIKFTRGGSVSLRITKIESPEPEVISLKFVVTDTGIGISPEDQHHLFDSFRQVDGSLSREFQGMGLGLAIAQKNVMLMGGKIGVESLQDMGSTFWFSIPFQQHHLSKPTIVKPQAPKESLDHKDEEIPPKPPEPILPPPYSIGSSTQILVVEDQLINRTVITKQLEMLEYTADSVEHGQLALDYLAQQSVELILLDCQMPVLNGYETTKAIRQWEGDRRHTTIVGLTGQALPGDREKCINVGMDDYLAKPVSMSQLRKTIEKWITTNADT